MLNRKNEIDIIESFVGIYDSSDDIPDIQKLFNEEVNKAASFTINRDYLIGFNYKISDNEHNSNLKKLDSDLEVLFFGEMYNFDDLCTECGIGKEDFSNTSFSELCGFLYRKHGAHFASKINGMFSIILLDRNHSSFFLYADRFGSAFPIYYHLSKRITFSSQLKLLLQCRDINRELDTSGLALFLKYSYVPSPRTIIQNIEKLGPGEVLIYEKNKLRKIRYVDFETEQVQSYDYKEAVEKYIEFLTKSIRCRMKGADSQRIGLFLSGGLDSSANLALASLHGDKEFKSFGIGFDDPKLDERPYARLAADHFGVEFNDYLFDGYEIDDLPKMVWYLDEPFMENGLFLTYSGFKSAKDKADLIIAGDGADQLFGTGGFAAGRPIAVRYLLDRFHCRRLMDIARRYLFNPSYKNSPLFKLKVMIDRSVNFNDWFYWGFDEKELNKLCNFSMVRDEIHCFSNVIEKNLRGFSDYYQYAIVHQDIEHYVCQNVLVKSFRMAELFGIRLREAYLDKDLMDFILPLNTNLKTKGNVLNFLKGQRTTKYLHRLAMENILPEKILKKPKQGGFIPMTILLADEKRRGAIFRYLENSEVVNHYMRKDFIKLLSMDYEKSTMGKNYWQSYLDSRVNQIMNLLVISLWYDIVFNNPGSIPTEGSLFQYISS